MPGQPPNEKIIYNWLCEQTPEGGRVLDLGCGEGELLAELAERRGVRGTGIELSEKCVVKAVQRGLSVHHGDAEEGMDHYSDGSFDIVILSLAIQEMGDPLHVIREAFRIGKQVLVVFPNFGYWRARWQLAIEGHAPRTLSFPYSWHQSPNRHFFTIADWEDLCRREHWRQANRGFVTRGKRVSFLPNLRAEVAMYAMEK